MTVAVGFRYIYDVRFRYIYIGDAQAPLHIGQCSHSLVQGEQLCCTAAYLACKLACHESVFTLHAIQHLVVAIPVVNMNHVP